MIKTSVLSTDYIREIKSISNNKQRYLSKQAEMLLLFLYSSLTSNLELLILMFI